MTTTATIPATTTAADTALSRTDAILTQLMAELAKPGSSLIPMLDVMRAFPRYSLSNQFLILAQKPTATWVKGYRAWQDAGYQVRKGEKGIAIWAPTTSRAKAEHVLVEHVDPATDAGNSDATTQRPRPRFRLAYVWDISSCDPIDGTTPIELPPAAPSAEPTSEPIADILESLKSVVTTLGFALIIEPLRPGLYGHTDGRTLTLAANADDATTACTLVHELAHALLHFDRTRDPRPDLTVRETEAEGVAYVVCETLGIPTASASVDYIRAYRGTPDTLRESLNHIRVTANRILECAGPPP